MNLYKFHNDPKSLHGHANATEEIPLFVPHKYKSDTLNIFLNERSTLRVILNPN